MNEDKDYIYIVHGQFIRIYDSEKIIWVLQIIQLKPK